MKERLQKILSGAGVCSRRQAEDHIRQGKVCVDGKVVTEMGVKIDPSRQKVTFNGKPLQTHTKKIYILLNKPKGYLTTLRDPQGRPIVTDLLQDFSQRLFPVGRLDLDTEGALIMTNDGDLAQKVIHPSYEIKKTYLAVIKGKINSKKITSLEKGIELDGRMTFPSKIKVMESQPHQTKLQIIIHEGRKRQVRRMFAAVNHHVIHLKRIAYGDLKLGNIPSGKYRFLNKKDLNKLF